MKRSLLASTAMGTLLAATTLAHAEGLGVRVFGGANWVGNESFSGFVGTKTFSPTTGVLVTKGMLGDFDFDADLGYVFGGAAGYGWDNGLSIDLEAAYRRNSLDISGAGFFAVHVSQPGTVFTTTSPFPDAIRGTDGHVEATSLMANAWYEFNLGNSALRPFVGGGAGFAWVDLHDIVEHQFTKPTYYGGSTTITISNGLHGSDSGFAWQLGGGLNWEIAPEKDLTLEYRYFNGPEVKEVRIGTAVNNIDYDYQSHSVMAGVKVGF